LRWHNEHFTLISREDCHSAVFWARGPPFHHWSDRRCLFSLLYWLLRISVQKRSEKAQSRWL